MMALTSACRQEVETSLDTQEDLTAACMSEISAFITASSSPQHGSNNNENTADSNSNQGFPSDSSRSGGMSQEGLGAFYASVSVFTYEQMGLSPVELGGVVILITILVLLYQRVAHSVAKRKGTRNTPVKPPQALKKNR